MTFLFFAAMHALEEISVWLMVVATASGHPRLQHQPLPTGDVEMAVCTIEGPSAFKDRPGQSFNDPASFLSSVAYSSLVQDSHNGRSSGAPLGEAMADGTEVAYGHLLDSPAMTAAESAAMSALRAPNFPGLLQQQQQQQQQLVIVIGPSLPRAPPAFLQRCIDSAVVRFGPAMRMNYVVWPLAHILNFALVPSSQVRVYLLAMMFILNIYCNPQKAIICMV